ncbi:UPF0149 family protein [Candidatus Methylospira mobilis]|uniref:UPF0149 family protein n=1 Tax=Candidatus Methylospira mobilis TaxID=1808979 RepID=UPI0028EF71A9|nr:UPF0149 family protein [Candidatus Methylospira mobilis]WNV03304.1 UPF0149 family protein [Candidatus Methylospira mobilis]
MKSLPEYEDIEDAIALQEDVASAAELHGLFCGMQCAKPGLDAQTCLQLVFGSGKGAVSDDDLEQMIALCESVREELSSLDFSFGLFLPDDDEALYERAQALGEWCQGFLYGLGAQAESTSWHGECQEILRHLVDIAQLDADAAGEENEAAFMELSEFVRMGVQLIYGETRAAAQPSRVH